MQLSEWADLRCAVLYGCDFSWGLMAVLFFVCSGSYGGLGAWRGPGFRGDAAGLVCGGAGHGDRHRSAATGGGAGAQSHVRQPAGQGKHLYSFQKCIKSLSFLPLTYTPQSFVFRAGPILNHSLKEKTWSIMSTSPSLSPALGRSLRRSEAQIRAWSVDPAIRWTSQWLDWPSWSVTLREGTCGAL